jgi:HAD superfamily hydrolase (TIGR01549 family)
LLKNQILGVIFDLDKTLVSSSLNFKAIKEEVGCPQNISILEYIDGFSDKKKLAITNRVIEFEIEDAQQSHRLIGTVELLALLTMRNIPFAVVTRNCRQAALMKLNKNGMTVPLLITRDDHLAKPAPDALLHIAAKWQVVPEKVLCVGDYIYDLQAAKNANMPFCLVTNGDEVEFAHLANMVVNDLTELVSFFESGIIDDRFC